MFRLPPDVLCWTLSWLTVREHLRWNVTCSAAHAVGTQTRAWKTIAFRQCYFSLRKCRSWVSRHTTHFSVTPLFPPRSGRYVQEVEFLADCTNLQHLSLPKQSVNSIAALYHMPALEHLDLSGSFIRYLRSLRQCVRLKVLRLNLRPWFKNPVEATDLKPLSCCTQLETLELHLEKSQKDIDALTSLVNLRYLRISAFGLRDLSPLQYCTRLESLILVGDFPRITCMDVLACFPQLRQLVVEQAGAEDWSAVGRCPQLKILEITHSPLRHVDFLAQCSLLEELRCQNCSYLENVDALAHCPRLKKLDLQWCKRVSCIDALVHHRHLSHVTLSGSGIKDLSALGASTGIVSLKVNDCIFLEDISVVSGLIHLRELEITGCPKVSSLEAVASCTRLRRFRCSGVSFTSKTLWPLSRLHELEHVELRNTSISNLYLVTHWPNLNSLNLELCQRLKNIRPLRFCQKLKDLSLSQTAVTNVSVLQHCPLLQRLWLRQTRVRHLIGLTRCSRFQYADIEESPLWDPIVLPELKRLFPGVTFSA